MGSCHFIWLNKKTLKISGTIDEHFSLDRELPKFPSDVWFDLRDIERINSCGVREWIKAIAKTPSRIHYINSSTVVVSQFSMIPEFIGKKSIVESFATHFVCPDCGHEDISILVVGKDIMPGQECYLESPELKCTACGEPMECDHNPELYFSFLSDAEGVASDVVVLDLKL